MHDYVWMFERLNRFEMAWPICGSLVFHVLLVLILNSASANYLVTGREARFDVIWATPSTPSELAASTPDSPEPLAPPAPVAMDALYSKEIPGEKAVSGPSDPVGWNTPLPAPPQALSSELIGPASKPLPDLEVILVSPDLPAQPSGAPAPATPAPRTGEAEQPKYRRKVSEPAAQQAPVPAPTLLARPRQEAPEPTPMVADPGGPQLSAELQDGPKEIAEQKPTGADLPKEPNEPDRQPAEAHELEVAEVRISSKPEEAKPQTVQRVRPDIPGSPISARHSASFPATAASIPAPAASIPTPAASVHIPAAPIPAPAASVHIPAAPGPAPAASVHIPAVPGPALAAPAPAPRFPVPAPAAPAKVVARPEKKLVPARQAALPPLKAQSRAAGVPAAGRLPRQQEVRARQNDPAPSPADGAASVVGNPAVGDRRTSGGDRSAHAGDTPATADRRAAEIPQQEKARPSDQPHQARGLVIAALRGDLKLVITGDAGIKLKVKFRDYPKSRRNKVLSRSEARREQAVVPLLATTRENTREAVIETAREGVYTFSAEPEGSKGAKAAFTLKAYESGPRERIAPLGTRTLSGSTILVKILMPEAILWDDESAFSGSMEDSESETKFNAATGLFWKEFHD